jgi:hypothetical protein
MSSETRSHPSRICRAPADRDYETLTAKRTRLTQDKAPENANTPMPASVLNRNRGPLVPQRKPKPKPKARNAGTLTAETIERWSVPVDPMGIEEDNMDLDIGPLPSDTEADNDVEELTAPKDLDAIELDIDEEEDAAGDLAEEENAEEELGQLRA